MDALLPNAGWALVQEALQRLREDNDRFEQFCGEQLDELERRRTQLVEREQQLSQHQAGDNRELAEARAQLTRLASVAVELADTRAELAELRSQFDEQQQIAATALQQAALYEQQARHLKQEVSALESEAEDHKRHSADERAEWMAELLRSAFERQPAPAADKKDADLKLVHNEQENSGEAAASAGRVDPVLSAVMAQFESLQKGRSGAAKPGRQGVA